VSRYPEPDDLNYTMSMYSGHISFKAPPQLFVISYSDTLIWINFDRHALLSLIQQCAGTFVADVDQIRPQFSNVADGGSVFQSSVVRSAGPSIGATINQIDTEANITSAGQLSQLATPWYSDQVLPFDITLSGANEYGAMCAAKIYGVEILNEGWGLSIDDAVSEM